VVVLLKVREVNDFLLRRGVPKFDIVNILIRKFRNTSRCTPPVPESLSQEIIFRVTVTLATAARLQPVAAANIAIAVIAVRRFSGILGASVIFGSLPVLSHLWPASVSDIFIAALIGWPPNAPQTPEPLPEAEPPLRLPLEHWRPPIVPQSH
jgi:hypothetical protein